MITAATPPLTPIITITNEDNLFVSVLLAKPVPGALDGLVTFCDTVIEAIVVVVCVAAGEAVIANVVDSIKFEDKVAICGTKEETDD